MAHPHKESVFLDYARNTSCKTHWYTVGTKSVGSEQDQGFASELTFVKIVAGVFMTVFQAGQML